MAKSWYYIIFTATNLLAFLFAAALLVETGLMYKQSFSLASGAGMPVGVFYGGFALGGLIAAISFLGLYGVCKKNILSTTLFMFLDLVLAIALLVVLIVTLLSVNNVSTIPMVDGPIAQIQGQLKGVLLNQALNDTKTWNMTEATFKCCGIDLNSTYSYPQYGVSDDTFVQMLQPGDECKTGRNLILQIHYQYPTYSNDSEKMANETLPADFFCKDKIIDFIHVNTVTVAGISGALIVIMFITSFAAYKLLCRVTTLQGGFITPKQDQNGGQLAFNNQVANQGGKPQVNQVSNGNQLV